MENDDSTHWKTENADMESRKTENGKSETDGGKRKMSPTDAVALAKVQQQQALNIIYRSVSKINARLVALKPLIANAQHKQPGAITLSLNACGGGCLACPHPTWYRWVGSRRRRNYRGVNIQKSTLDKGRFVAVRVKYPLKVIAQSQAVKDYTAAIYVAEAVRLLERRSSIIKHLSWAKRLANKLNA